MKIALLIPSWPPGSIANGIVTYASELVPAFRRLGHDVYILTPFHANGDDDPQTIDLRPHLSKMSVLDRVMFKLFPETTLFNRISGATIASLREMAQSKKVD